ncbi:hypothetical protein ACKFKF_05740 [Phormidesmis sp. 146-12]
MHRFLKLGLVGTVGLLMSVVEIGVAKAATTAALPNMAAAVNSTVMGTEVESTLIARSNRRRSFQGAPAPAWRRRCEMRPFIIGYKNQRVLTNPQTYRVPTQSGWRTMRSSGQKIERVPITQQRRVCRTV